MDLVLTSKGIINLAHLVRAQYLEPSANGHGPWMTLTLSSITMEKDSLGYDGSDPVAVGTSETIKLHGAEADALWRHLNESAFVLATQEA